MKILVVAGEASADIHASHVIEKLKEKTEVSLIGIGGDRLIHAGLVNPVITAREMAVVGLTEVIKKIPQTFRILNQLEELAKNEKPDFALLLDLPDFNLRLAPKLKAAGIPVIYYVSPQVWAWRSSRVKHMSKCIDLLLSILPFEKPWYEINAPKDLKIEYVGHPVIEEIPNHPYEPIENQIAVLPGSRESEWMALFPTMLESVLQLKIQMPELKFIIPRAEILRKSELVNNMLDRETGIHAKSLQILGDAFVVVDTPAHEILRKSKLAIVASGTATLEAGIVGTPMIVIYKVSAFTAFLFRSFIRYKGAIAIVNLVHKGLGSTDKVVPELMQEDANPEKISFTAMEILKDSVKWHEMVHTLGETRRILSGVNSPLDNAAKEILAFYEKHTKTS